MFLLHIRRFQVQFSLKAHRLQRVFCGFPHFLQLNAGIKNYDCFLTRPFNLITSQPSLANEKAFLNKQIKHKDKKL